MQTIEVADRGDRGLDLWIGRAELLAAVAEQDLSGILDAALGLALPENSLIDRRLLDPADSEQHSGYPLDDCINLLLRVAQPHQDPGRVPERRRLLGAGLPRQPLRDRRQHLRDFLRLD